MLGPVWPRRGALTVPLLCALLFSHAGFPQELRVPFVENTGEATVHVVPNQVDFWLHYQTQAENLEDAMALAKRFPGQVDAQLNEAKLSPIDVERMAPAVTAIDEKIVAVSVRLRFNMANFTNIETGPQLFARLCDQISAMGGRLDCRVVGPLLGVSDRGAVVKEAVRVATENAYPPAEAVAGALSTIIYAVDTVQVLGVEWNRLDESGATVPNLGQVTCTASVKVLYALSEQQ